MSHHETASLAAPTIEPALLATVVGGQAQQQGPAPGPEGDGDMPRRTWGQIAGEYGAACMQGAGQSLIFAGRPRTAREGLKNAGLGCAMGVGMKAVDDVSGLLTGRPY